MVSFVNLPSYILCTIFVFTGTEDTFGALRSGNPGNTKRGCDRYGCGNYGASRNGHRHLGLDMTCADGATVYAPFDIQLDFHAKPYDYGNKIDDGIQFKGQEKAYWFYMFSIMSKALFYVKPDKIKGRVKKGEKIGIMLPMQGVYPEITSHVHVQMCDLSDPTIYF
ncbi:LECT2 protein, partial [Atractosteus spatula]|nr:LECT2 protein [Atractosteus spatula]